MKTKNLKHESMDQVYNQKLNHFVYSSTTESENQTNVTTEK